MEDPTCARWWCVDVSAWQPGSPDWERAIQLLPGHEQQRVTRFLFAKDQRLALGSRVLQRRLISALFNVPGSQIDIQRTPEGKPFWASSSKRDSYASQAIAPPETWNYNVSHHGTIVAIASHPHRLVGVDVVQISERPSASTSAADFFRAFADHFNASEWAYIYGNSSSSSAGDGDEYARFYRLWSLKEAYIKAVGIGLGFALLRAEFAFDDTLQQWQLTLDGRFASEWRFASTQLDAAHLVSVALGPLEAMWSPSTSCIFSTPSVAFSDTSAALTSDETLERTWEWKELSDLIA